MHKPRIHTALVQSPALEKKKGRKGWREGRKKEGKKERWREPGREEGRRISSSSKKENLSMRRIITFCPVLMSKIYDVRTISLLLSETIQKQTGNEGLKGLYIMWKMLEN